MITKQKKGESVHDFVNRVRLIQLLNENEKSHRWLAEQLGVTPSCVTKWVGGINKIGNLAQMAIRRVDWTH